MSSKKLQIRPLRASEVTFSVEVEPEEIPYKGNCSAIDPKTDRESEEWIRKRLANEQVEAWCTLVVKATWEGIEGWDSLGCVSIDAGLNADGDTVRRHVDRFAKEAGMFKEALSHLNKEVERQALQCLDIINRLKVVVPRRKRASKR